MNHLSLDDLLAYSQNRVSAEARLRMTAHLQQCALCTRELSVIANTLFNPTLFNPTLFNPSLSNPSLSNPTLPNALDESLADLPAHLMRRVLVARQRQRPKNAVQRIVPVQLHYDSRTSAVAQGIRGNAQDRQILFSSGDYEIDLHLFTTGTTQVSQAQFSQAQFSQAKFSLQGQILSQSISSITELEGFRVVLTNQESIDRLVFSDEFGRFSFSDLILGIYTLTIELPEGDAKFQSLQIG